ncbi:elongation of very long chain fatty acids protein-like protein [Dinothrombium tinctorium]|uniref:Elongation of very long chain fatty acids protein n=1 Tax=Dinothrombium tinctorium TaxID=1965070 RepID=A0A443RBW6_9ACAR|nr:elongation of very long chain fatty acids protein-like protein [Dinothrombium tinctorium]
MSRVLYSTTEIYEWLMSKAGNSLTDQFPQKVNVIIYVRHAIVDLATDGQPISNTVNHFFGGSITYLSGKYSFICQPIDYTSDFSMKFVRLGWWFLLLKIAEFTDTIFFVLRKKYSQISALHVVHHSLVAWGVWIGLKFGAGGHNAFFPFINCGVHMIMYTYYCLSALGPKVRKYLWWKKYLTILQMVQFVVVIIHACIPLFIDCGFNPMFAYLLIAHAVLFYIMFYNFYTNAYSSKKSVLESNYTNNNSYDSDCHSK